MSDDVRLHREWLLSCIDLPEAGLMVDLGCGSGEPWYGYARAHDFSFLVEKRVVSPEDYRRFIGGLENLQEQGRYFYSITGYAYVGRLLCA